MKPPTSYKSALVSEIGFCVMNIEDNVRARETQLKTVFTTSVQIMI